MKHRIVISLEGGFIQDISNIPADVIVEVRDFDSDGREEEALSETPEGDKFILSEWTHDPH